MNRWIVAAAIPLVFGIALAACIGNGDGTGVLGGPCPSKTPAMTEIEGDVTTDELVDLVTKAMTCPGYAFHMRSAGDQEAGPYSSHGETEVWVDIENNLGRVEIRSRFTSEEALAEAEKDDYDPEWRSTVITRGDGSYSSEEIERPSRKGRPPNCHGPGREAIGLVFQCYNGPLQDIEISIDVEASYGSHSAFAYVAEGESSGSDETYDTTTRTFFDADTLLPIGQTVEGTLDIGDIFPVQADLPYETGFVPLDSLPADFFDPASIGYVEKDEEDVEEPLDSAEIAVYWLGSTFEGSGEYPALALDFAFARKQAETLEFGSIVEITYRPADDEFGYPAVKLGLYPPASWEEETQQNPCEETVGLDLPGLQATLRRHYHNLPYDPGASCPPHDRFSASVYIEDVLVRIEAPRVVSGGEYFDSPYNSEAAMELLVRSLELRE